MDPGRSLSAEEKKYLGIISDPPDVGDRSHLAGPQNSSQVHLLVLHGHKGSGEMDMLQLTCVHTHASHRERLARVMHRVEEIKNRNNFISSNEGREREFIGGW